MGFLMPTPAQLLAAVPHIANDMLVLRQAHEYRHLRVAWTAWYPLARNVATFLEVVQGSKGDIRAREFFDRGTPELKRWQDARAARLTDAPAALGTLYGHASQAAAHLSWKRVTAPNVQRPSKEVTHLLLMLWADFVAALPEPYKRLFLDEWARLHPRQRRRGARPKTGGGSPP
jgi:hypothetical protein